MYANFAIYASLSIVCEVKLKATLPTSTVVVPVVPDAVGFLFCLFVIIGIFSNDTSSMQHFTEKHFV